MKQERTLSFSQARVLEKKEIEVISGGAGVLPQTMDTTYTPTGFDTIIDV